LGVLFAFVLKIDFHQSREELHRYK